MNSDSIRSLTPVRGNGWYELTNGQWGFFRWVKNIPKLIRVCDHNPSQEEHDQMEYEERYER